MEFFLCKQTQMKKGEKRKEVRQEKSEETGKKETEPK